MSRRAELLLLAVFCLWPAAALGRLQPVATGRNRPEADVRNRPLTAKAEASKLNTKLGGFFALFLNS